ncbi:MAG: copper chaperone PCu(A)C [Hyphomicrobiales bacterium]
MQKLALQIAIAAALTIAAILSLAAHARANEIVVTGAYARASSGSGARTGALYLTIGNESAAPDTLLAVSTDAASGAMIHETAVENGIATMRHVEKLDIAPGEEASFAPGGMHIMLMGLKKPLRRGDRLRVTLTFRTAGDVRVDVPVAGVGATAPP